MIGIKYEKSERIKNSVSEQAPWDWIVNFFQGWYETGICIILENPIMRIWCDKRDWEDIDKVIKCLTVEYKKRSIIIFVPLDLVNTNEK